MYTQTNLRDAQGFSLLSVADREGRPGEGLEGVVHVYTGQIQPGNLAYLNYAWIINRTPPLPSSVPYRRVIKTFQFNPQICQPFLFFV